MMNTIATKLNNAQAYISRHYALKLMKVSAPHAYDNEYGEGHYELTWAIDAALIASPPFQIGELTFAPALDMICMGCDENTPTLEWGVWPVKKEIFADTYEKLI